MKLWLIKSEESCYSIDDLKKEKETFWGGVRNFQARNFMIKDMRVGDLALFHYSNGNPSGVIGVMEVSSKALPDLTAQDKKDEHFDPKATCENPIWYGVKFKFVKKFPSILSLEEIKKDKILKNMIVAKRGNRLSVMPVSEKEFERVENWFNE